MSTEEKEEAQPLTLEENELFVSVILKPMLQLVDMAANTMDVERLKATTHNMRDRQSTVAAFPFQETMDKADDLAAMNKVFESVLKVIIARKEQIDMVESRSDLAPGQEVLKHLGF